jgi:GDP-4-dehydro-6-deoxy-D-mannose reductase
MSGGGNQSKTLTRIFTPTTASSTVRRRNLSEVVLVTGANGFVGSHLIAALARTGDSQTIVAWQRPQRVPSAISFPPRPFGNVPSVERQQIDLLDRVSVAKGISELKPDTIYHCAGIANVLGTWSDTTNALEVNVRGTQYLLDAIASEGLVSRILIPGSALIYKSSNQAILEDDPIRPLSPYAVSKLAQELLGRRFAIEGLKIILTRSFTHFGPGQDLSFSISSFCHQIAKIEAGKIAPVIQVGQLDAQRDLVDVQDTVLAYMALMSKGNCNEPYNVCSGQSYRIGDILDNLLSQSHASVRVEIDPSRLRPNDCPLLLGDPTRIRKAVGWEAHIELTETLKKLLNYWRFIIRAD